MKITYTQASRDDVMLQIRFYLLAQNFPDVATRFKEAVRRTANAIRERPGAAPPYRVRNPRLQDLRSWPEAGFESVRFYFLVEEHTIRIIRILHGKRDVRSILERQE